MTRELTPRSRPRLAGLALLLAWLVFLGVLGAGAGYVLTVPEQPVTAAREPGAAVSLPTAPEPEPAKNPAQAEAPPPAPAPATTPARVPPPTPPQVAETTPAPQEGAPARPSAPAAPKATQEAALPRPGPPATRPLWQRNGQAFDEAEKRPRIAVVMTGLGLSSTATEAAIKQLPGAITLSFTPYSRRLNEWVALARVNGHEVMLDVPMEPTSYPDDDPGPMALLTALSPAQNLERLQWALQRTTGYVGVAVVMGSRFTASAQALEPVLAEIKDRGLIFLDNRASDDSVASALAAKLALPNAVNDRDLDRVQASRMAIDARLVQLETVARAQGAAVAMARPYPVTIERLRAWAGKLDSRGLVLAPITAVAGRQPRQEANARNSGAE